MLVDPDWPYLGDDWCEPLNTVIVNYFYRKHVIIKFFFLILTLMKNFEKL